MHSIQALREQRAAKAKELHELVNVTTKDKKWTPENQAVYDAGMAEIEMLDGQISRIEASNRLIADRVVEDQIVDNALRVARDDQSEAAKIFAKWLRGGDKALDESDWAKILNTMDTTTGADGGYTVPNEVASTVIEALKQFGGMRAVADVLVTATGRPLNYPTSDGTAEEGEIVDQNTSATDLDIAFGTLPLSVYKFSSKVVTVPIELLQDSTIDVEAFTRKRLVTRLGRVTNKKFTIGTGTNEPTGVATAAQVGRTGATGQTVTVIYDDLVELQHSVDPAYREQGNCRFMMHDQSMKLIRKLKDQYGRPIFVPGYETAIPGKPGGMPDTLLGDPVQINQHVATMAADAISILYGDFKHYVIRDALEIQMLRFTDSAYAKKGQVGFLAFLRSGGNLMDVGTSIMAYKNSHT